MQSLELVFNTNRVIFLFLGLGLALMLLGLAPFFVYKILEIPPLLKPYALWTFLLMLLAFVFDLMRIPYFVLLSSYEELSCYAVVSLLDVFFRWGGIALLPVVLPSSSPLLLLGYGAVLLLSSIGQFFFYWIYSKKRFASLLSFRFQFQKRLAREMLTFASQHSAVVFFRSVEQYGTNIALNVFFSPLVNASKGVAQQVNNGLMSLVSNFFLAFNPTLYKSYSEENRNKFERLFYLSSKLSFCFVLLLVIPLFIGVNFLMRFWLVEVPAYTIDFTKLFLMNALLASLLDAFSNPLLASARLRGYTIGLSLLSLGSFLLSFFFLYRGASPLVTAWISILFCFLGLCLRAFLLYQQLGFQPWKLLGLFLRLFSFAGVAFFSLNAFFSEGIYSWGGFILMAFLSSLFLLALTVLWVFSREERKSFYAYLSQKISFL